MWYGCITYQLPLPPPFFLVFLGSSPAKPFFAKKRGRCSDAGAVPSATAEWSLSLNLCERVTADWPHVSVQPRYSLVRLTTWSHLLLTDEMG